MTLIETRQLGIEFERRVQTMIPETEFLAKLDTDTIYSYINQYQDKLIQELYRTIDQVETSNNETYLETLLNSMMQTATLTLSNTEPIRRSELPADFGLYIKSYSNVSNTYKYRTSGQNQGILPNKLISIKEVNEVISRPQDSMRIIRSPFVWLADENGLGSLYDSYTTPTSIYLEYYRLPHHMDLMTSTPCELPIEMFEQLVSGAVDLYVQYAAGAEARKKQMQQAQQQQNKNNENEE